MSAPTKKDDDPTPPSNPMKKSNKDPKLDTSAIATELENLTATAFTAINDRNWTYLLDSSQSHIAPWITTSGTGMRPAATSLSKLISDFQAFTTEWPDYRLNIVSMSTQIYKNVSCAEVFANCDVTGGPGFPVGMSRKTVSCFEFQRVGSGDGDGEEGVWMAVRDTTIPGAGEDRGGFWG